MTMYRETILLAEDDQLIAQPLVDSLETEGFQVIQVTTGPDALQIARTQEPDVALVDVMLPDLDGVAVCSALRRECDIPVIMMTARRQEMDQMMGLNLNAEDYIVKPFGFRELLARIRTQLEIRERERTIHPPKPKKLAIGQIVLDPVSGHVTCSGSPMELSAREFALLKVLMEHCGEALARQDLIDMAWGKEWWVGDPRVLDIHIKWLREKLEIDPQHPRYLLALRGFGYRFVDPGSFWGGSW